MAEIIRQIRLTMNGMTISGLLVMLISMIEVVKGLKLLTKILLAVGIIMIIIGVYRIYQIIIRTSETFGIT